METDNLFWDMWMPFTMLAVDEDNSNKTARLPQCPTTWLTWPRRRRRRPRSSQLLTLLRQSPLHPDLLSGLFPSLLRHSINQSINQFRVELPNIPAGIGAQSTQPIFTHQLFKVHLLRWCHHHHHQHRYHHHQY